MRILAWLRANFLTGLVVVAPVGLTIYLVWTTIGVIDSWVLPWIPASYQPSTILGVDIRGVGLAVFLIFTMIVGYIAKGLFGRWLLHRGELLVARMPIVRSVYRGLKQIAEAIIDKSAMSFDRVCLVEYPRRGVWAIGFYSNDARSEVRYQLCSEKKFISVFIPTTPNPTSGFMLFVPEVEVKYMEMSVEDAAKLVISAGLVYPPDDPAKEERTLVEYTS